MKAYTDISQSKKLAEILPLESADLGYLKIPNSSAQGFNYSDYPYPAHLITRREHKLPCWGLAALLDVLEFPSLHKHIDGKWGCDSWIGGVNPYSIKGAYDQGADNPVDACYAMIIHLYEQNLL